MRSPLGSLSLVITMVAGSVLVAALAASLALLAGPSKWMDAEVAAAIRADYSGDLQGNRLPPLDEGIIEDARGDAQSEEAGNQPGSASPTPGTSPGPSGAPSPGPRSTVTPTPTPRPPTPTPVPTLPLPTLPLPTPTLPLPTLPLPTPTLPPVPTLPPLPTVPLLPTAPPLPTVPLPTLPQLP